MSQATKFKLQVSSIKSIINQTVRDLYLFEVVIVFVSCALDIEVKLALSIVFQTILYLSLRVDVITVMYHKTSVVFKW